MSAFGTKRTFPNHRPMSAFEVGAEVSALGLFGCCAIKKEPQCCGIHCGSSGLTVDNLRKGRDRNPAREFRARGSYFGLLLLVGIAATTFQEPIHAIADCKDG